MKGGATKTLRVLFDGNMPVKNVRMKPGAPIPERLGLGKDLFLPPDTGLEIVGATTDAGLAAQRIADSVGAEPLDALRAIAERPEFYGPQQLTGAKKKIFDSQQRLAAGRAKEGQMTRGLKTPNGITGVLAAGAMGGIGGYTMGEQDFTSFATGAAVGVGAGGFARPAARDALASAIRHTVKNSKVIASNNPEGAKQMMDAARAMGRTRRAMNTKEGRYLMHAGGSLLAGGAFGGMFMSGNRKNHRRGFNQNRGNTF